MKKLFDNTKHAVTGTSVRSTALSFAVSFLMLFPSACSFTGESAVKPARPDLISKDLLYTVVDRDYGDTIAGKLGIPWKRIADANSLAQDAPLRVGMVLKSRFMRILPRERLDNGIIINIPDRTLYRFENGSLKDYFFVAPGKPSWPTPTGDFTLKAKAEYPTWLVPPAIRKEMEAEGKEAPEKVPPGPSNPLGKHWLQLSISGIGLHGTIAPESIYHFSSHGCMRLTPEAAEFLYKDVAVGTKGKIIYEPVKIIKTAEGGILLEVYGDIYKKGTRHLEEVERLLKGLHAEHLVDPGKVKEALRRKDGAVTDVTRK